MADLNEDNGTLVISPLETYRFGHSWPGFVFSDDELKITVVSDGEWVLERNGTNVQWIDVSEAYSLACLVADTARPLSPGSQLAKDILEIFDVIAGSGGHCYLTDPSRMPKDKWTLHVVLEKTPGLLDETAVTEEDHMEFDITSLLGDDPGPSEQDGLMAAVWELLNDKFKEMNDGQDS